METETKALCNYYYDLFHGDGQWRIQDFSVVEVPTLHGGRQRTILPNVPQKLYEIKRIWDSRGSASLVKPFDPPSMPSLVYSAAIMHANKIHQRQYRSQLLPVYLLECLGIPSVWMVSLADQRGCQGCAPTPPGSKFWIRHWL